MDFKKLTCVRELGRGTYGSVKECVTPAGARVAVKRFAKDNEGLAAATIRELHCLSTLRGAPHVVRLLGVEARVGADGYTRARIALPLHKGDLKQFIVEVPAAERLQHLDRLFAQMLTALRYAHERGVLHRDVKPQNILVDYEYDPRAMALRGAPDFYLADWGLARQAPCDPALRPRSKGLTVPVYTVWYRPPEATAVINSGYSAAADLWALGATFYEYITGQPLLSESSEDALLAALLPLLAAGPWNSGRAAAFAGPQGAALFTEELKKGAVHANVDVSRLQTKLAPRRYAQVPPYARAALAEMLSVHPDDRGTAAALLAAVPAPSSAPAAYQIERGHPRRRAGLILSQDVNLKMYYILTEWMMEIVEEWRLDAQTAVAAIDLLDRYLAARPALKRDKLQLSGVCCLFVADKMFSAFHASVADWVRIGGGSYTAEQLKQAELDLLDALGYVVQSCESDALLEALRGVKPGPALRALYRWAAPRALPLPSMPYPAVVAELGKSGALRYPPFRAKASPAADPLFYPPFMSPEDFGKTYAGGAPLPRAVEDGYSDGQIEWLVRHGAPAAAFALQAARSRRLGAFLLEYGG